MEIKDAKKWFLLLITVLVLGSIVAHFRDSLEPSALSVSQLNVNKSVSAVQSDHFPKKSKKKIRSNKKVKKRKRVSFQLSINAASVEQLDTIPNITKKMAQSIVDYRQKNGPFFSKEEYGLIPKLSVKGLKNLIAFTETNF